MDNIVYNYGAGRGTLKAPNACRVEESTYSAPLLRGGENMDVQTVSTFISTVGFPIAACVALYLQNVKMSEALNNNTLALTELSTLIKEGKKQDGEKQDK